MIVLLAHEVEEMMNELIFLAIGNRDDRRFWKINHPVGLPRLWIVLNGASCVVTHYTSLLQQECIAALGTGRQPKNICAFCRQHPDSTDRDLKGLLALWIVDLL